MVPPLSLKKEGKPVNYQAPKEGAIAWVDGLSLMKAAKNTDQVYAFLDYLQTPEASAAVAEGSGYNPTITGADALLSDVAKKNFQEAFPGDALNEPLALAGGTHLVCGNPQPVRRQVQGRLIAARHDRTQASPGSPGLVRFRGMSWFYLIWRAVRWKLV